MKYIIATLFIFFCHKLIAQKTIITATKGKREIVFHQNKKYIFTLSNTSRTIYKGTFTLHTDTSFLLTHKHGIDTVSLSQVKRIYNYKSFINFVGAVGEVVLGALLIKATIENGSGFLNTLLGITGALYIIDGILIPFGVQDIGVLANKPSVDRGFVFSIK